VKECHASAKIPSVDGLLFCSFMDFMDHKKRVMIFKKRKKKEISEDKRGNQGRSPVLCYPRIRMFSSRGNLLGCRYVRWRRISSFVCFFVIFL